MSEAETPPDYTHEYTVGEDWEWDYLPDDVIPLAENETHVKLALIDTIPIDTIHAEKEVLRNKHWDSTEHFRESIEWGVYTNSDILARRERPGFLQQ